MHWWKYGRGGLLGPYGSLGLFKRDWLLCTQHASCRGPLHSTHHIHQGPTGLAAGPAQLLTSEPTSRGMQSVGRGTGGGWMCRILGMFSAWVQQRSLQAAGWWLTSAGQQYFLRHRFNISLSTTMCARFCLGLWCISSSALN